MAKAFKVSGHGLESDWLNGSEFLDMADHIICEINSDYEAWNIMDSVGDLEDKGYSVDIKSVTYASVEKTHIEQIKAHLKHSF